MDLLGVISRRACSASLSISFRETLPSYRQLHGLERALQVASIVASGRPADALMVSYGLPDHWLGLSILLEKEVYDARRS